MKHFYFGLQYDPMDITSGSTFTVCEQYNVYCILLALEQEMIFSDLL